MRVISVHKSDLNTAQIPQYASRAVLREMGHIEGLWQPPLCFLVYYTLKESLYKLPDPAIIFHTFQGSIYVHPLCRVYPCFLWLPGVPRPLLRLLHNMAPVVRACNRTQTMWWELGSGSLEYWRTRSAGEPGPPGELGPRENSVLEYFLEMGSKLEISPYLFNHHYESNNPKILAPTPIQ